MSVLITRPIRELPPIEGLNFRLRQESAGRIGQDMKGQDMKVGETTINVLISALFYAKPKGN